MLLKLYNGYDDFSLTVCEEFLTNIKKEEAKSFFNYTDTEELMDEDVNFIKVYAVGNNDSEGWEAIFSTILFNPYIFVGTLADENTTLIGYGQSIYALNQKTGELLWNFEAYELKEIIIDKNDRAIYVHDETDIHKLGLDGREMWKYAHHEIIVQIEVDNRAIILYDLNNQTYRMDAKIGKIQEL